MSLSIAAVVAGSLLTMSAIGALIGYVTHEQQQRRNWAATTWRNVTHRNGVTERSPFHSPESSYNAPGMVRVYPRSHTPTPPATHTHVSRPADIPEVRPRPASAMPNPVQSTVRTDDTLADELNITPLELSEPPHPRERDICRQVYREGNNQTKTIKRVWGLSKGGGKRYAEARRRFQAHVKDIARPELRYVMKEAEAKASAE